MPDPAIVEPALGLVFILGLRHGLDPDHVAVIDNIVFRAVETRPRIAPWTGTFFALGHSLAVGAVAIGVSLVSALFTMPVWVASAMEWAVIVLLLLVGWLNLQALSGPDYAPVGWRTRLIPSSLRASTHPLAIIAIGIIFGLVFDTATQAAAWGAAASTMGGLAAAVAVAGAFAIGMLLSDTLDSQIVARLLRSSGEGGRIRTYRRAVGWVIVTLSFGMAAYAISGAVGVAFELSDLTFTAIGAGTALLVIAILLRAKRLRRLGLGGV